MYRNLILCNLYKKLCINLVSIKKLYYDARPTKSQKINTSSWNWNAVDCVYRWPYQIPVWWNAWSGSNLVLLRMKDRR